MSVATIAMHSVLIVLLIATIWRVWVLSKNVAKATEAAEKSRSRLSDSSAASPNAVVYPVAISDGSLKESFLVQKPASTSDDSIYAKAVFLQDSQVAHQLARDVADGAVKVAYIASEAYELAAARDYSAVDKDAVSRGMGSESDVLLWATRVDETENKMPLPSKPDPDRKTTDGYFKAYVLGF